MAYEIVPEPGEEVQTRIELKLSKKAKPFFFGVSNRAIYIPRIQLIARPTRIIFSECGSNKFSNSRLSDYLLMPFG